MLDERRVNGWRLGETLFSQQAIERRVVELAAEISTDYDDKELTLIGVLKGSYIFLADLTRALNVPARVDFLGLSSYDGAESTGSFQWTARLTTGVRDRHVLVVEDIIDTGRTLREIIDRLRADDPASLRVCALLDKPSRRVAPVVADYVGFEIPDLFVVGYGLDIDGWFRKLPYVAALERADES